MKKPKLLHSSKDFEFLSELILNKECGYIHNPKTAGTSFWGSLKYYSLLEPGERQGAYHDGFLLAHTPLKYRKNGAEYMYPYNRKFTLCIIRDPIERN